MNEPMGSLSQNKFPIRQFPPTAVIRRELTTAISSDDFVIELKSANLK